MTKKSSGASRSQYEELGALRKVAGHLKAQHSGTTSKQVEAIHQALQPVRDMSIKYGGLMRKPTFANQRLGLLNYKFKQHGINWAGVAEVLAALPEGKELTTDSAGVVTLLSTDEKAICEAQIESWFEHEFDVLDPRVPDPDISMLTKASVFERADKQILRLIDANTKEARKPFVSSACELVGNTVLLSCEKLELVHMVLATDVSFFRDQRRRLVEEHTMLAKLLAAYSMSTTDLLALATALDEMERAGLIVDFEHTANRLAKVWQAFQRYRNRSVKSEPAARLEFRRDLGL